MQICLKIVGIFISSLGIACLLDPKIFNKSISFFLIGKRIYTIGAIKAAFGLFLILSGACLPTRAANVIFILGILVLLCGIFSLGLAVFDLRDILGKLQNAPIVVKRVVAVVYIVIGFIIASLV